MALTTQQKGEIYTTAADIQSEIAVNQERNAELNVELGRLRQLVSDEVIDSFGEPIEDAQLQKIFTKLKDKVVKLKIKPGKSKKVVKE